MSQLVHPTYDRSRIKAGIVHFGVGNFHRSHQAMFIDRLLRRGEAFEWGICGVGLLPGDLRMRDVLRAQDYLYTLVERRSDGTMTANTIGSIVDYLYAPDDYEAVVAKLAHPDTRIVSLTVTEGGYNIIDATGEFNLDAPDVKADPQPGAIPRTTFGLIVEGLRRRRETGTPPFTVMSCDNLQGNGEVAHRACIAFATAVDPDLGAWIDERVRFPNSMVDRITPVTTDADRQLVEAELGIIDGWPVMCEEFVQWVLEDQFTLGRLALELVGVQTVNDVTPYEKMKLRLLNAGHQAIAHFGTLCGYRFVHEAASDPMFVSMLQMYFEEASLTLDPVPGIDLDLYKRQLIERFANPHVRDRLARLATDASDRVPKFVVPVITERAEAQGKTPIADSIIAAWARSAEGVDDTGISIQMNDRQAARIRANSERASTDPLGFVRDQDLFGDLADRPVFAEPYLAILGSLRTNGARQTLAALLAGAWS